MDQPTKEWCIEHKLGLSAVRKKFPEFYNTLQERFPGLGVSEQLYIHFYGKPVCKICGKPVKYINFIKGYWDCCSSKCHAQYATEARKKTCLERYGVPCNLMSEDSKEKIKKTCLERYGTEHYTNLEKAKQTCIDRYGVPCNLMSVDSKEKIKKTCLERYGTENPMQNEEVQAKSRKTCIERYGVPSPLHSEEIREKAKQSCIDKYGVPYGFLTIDQGSVENLQKITSTCIDKYGVPYGFLNTEHGYSKASQQLFNQLSKYFPNAQYATNEYRVGPYLLDWYDPDSNTVIEFNGDYWHANPKLYSPNWIHPKKHCTAQSIWDKDKKKLDYLKSLGYKVIVVWESEADINKILEELCKNQK